MSIKNPEEFAKQYPKIKEPLNIEMFEKGIESLRENYSKFKQKANVDDKQFWKVQT